MQDPETYIHRSGRTGRAGSTGVSVTLVDRKKEGLIPFIQRRAGVAFERIGAPQPAEMARIAGANSLEQLRGCGRLGPRNSAHVVARIAGVNFPGTTRKRPEEPSVCDVPVAVLAC